MASSGWYPDPGGSPGRFRYWDGNTWSAQTTANPTSTPPAGQGDHVTGGRRSERGWIVALVVLALVTILVVAGLMFASGSVPGTGGKTTEDTNSSPPTVDAWDETSTPTDTPPPTGIDNGEWVDCPWSRGKGNTTQVAGRLTSAGLSVDLPPEYEEYEFAFVMAYDFHAVSRSTPYALDSAIGVGRISLADGFTQLSTAANQAMQCWSVTTHSHTEGHAVLIAGVQITVSGQPAWHVQWEIFSKYEDVPNEILDVIVIDMGPGADYFGLYLSCHPAGDRNFEARITAAMSSLRVT